MTGIAPSKIRFYEKHGLLETHKDESGYRYFTPNDAFRVNAFRMLLQYGFTVEQSVQMLEANQGEEWFVEKLKEQVVSIDKEIALQTSRKTLINKVVDLLEEEATCKLEVIYMPDFLYVYASQGLDFSISATNKKELAIFADLLSMSYYARIFKMEEFIRDYDTVHPSYAFAIAAINEEYLGHYDKSKVEYLSLGRCVRYIRKVNRLESEQRRSFKNLFDYLQKNNYQIRGDLILLPTFLKLDNTGRDFETIYVPIK
jgi:DNA-binding transcriptional MerR regulator